jgi:hypothetical protein
VARRRAPTQRKLRTREHVLADLAVNHVERQVLLRGHTVERFTHDYGIDLSVVTYNAAGEVENGLILLQVKGTERAQRLARQQAITFRVERPDLLAWLAELLPVILIVYDAASDVAYWVHVQGYFLALPGFDLFHAGRTVNVHLPIAQTLTPGAVAQFAVLRDQVYARHPGA